MRATEQEAAGSIADRLIATEVAIQDRMWGDANDRADSTKNQLLAAGAAQINAIFFSRVVMAQHSFYPEDWDGFRDYGSDVANLVVAAAFIRSEIKRRVLLGEDTTRAKRGEAYTKPYVSSDVAAAELSK
jgi:hypothetical protein